MSNMRFGLDAHPKLARVYALAVMLLLPVLFPVLFVIAYAPDAFKQLVQDLLRNYRDAWRVFRGKHHRR